MATRVAMPKLGESVTEGTVERWLKRVGDRVEEWEDLVEVTTDKVNTVLPAPVSGVLAGILVPEGQTVAVGQDLAIIEESGAMPSPAAGPGAEAAPDLSRSAAAASVATAPFPAAPSRAPSP